MRIAAECEALLHEMPTTLEHDKQLLMTKTWEQNADMPWRFAEHKQLALAYRIARKQTLHTVIQDLHAVARLLSAEDM